MNRYLRKNKHSNSSLVLDFFKENLLLTAGVFCVGLFSITTTLLIPILIGKYYQLALHSHSNRGKILDAIFGEITEIKSFFLLFGIIIIARLCFNYLESFLSGICAEKFAKSLREQLFKAQLSTTLGEFEKKATGNYLLRYSGDLTAITNFLSKGIIGFINDAVFVSMTLVLFFIINKTLAWIILVSFPVVFASILVLNLKLKKYTVKRRDIRSQNLGFVTTRLNALLTIKVFNRESPEQQQFDKRSLALFQNGIRYYRWYALITSLLPFLLYTMLGFILFIAYQLNQQQTTSIEGSQIIIFIMLTISVIPILKRILKVNIVWQTGRISMRKLLLILNSPKEKATDEQQLIITQGRIEFKQLCFGNQTDNLLFDKLNVTIPHFGLYQLNGPQGSGKSTLFKLLLGIYELKSGSILLDGVDLSKISRKKLRKNVTLVSGELTLLGKTIFEAVSYSRKEEKKEAVYELLNSLGFFNSPDETVDSPLVEGGKNLSAGQRKLLSLARALMTNKKIMLLDEPFADLDNRYKSTVIELLNQLKKERTILIIDKERNDHLVYDDCISLPDPISH